MRDTRGPNALDTSHRSPKAVAARAHDRRREFRKGTPAAPQSGWTPAAAQRLRFILDFGYATGLRASELVGATLGDIETDAHGDAWLKVIGKGSKAARVALPPLARTSRPFPGRTPAAGHAVALAARRR